LLTIIDHCSTYLYPKIIVQPFSRKKENKCLTKYNDFIETEVLMKMVFTQLKQATRCLTDINIKLQVHVGFAS